MKIEISEFRCPQNHRCPAVSVCPVDAMFQDGNGLPYVDDEKCIGCMKCTRFCPMGAIIALKS